MKLAALDLDDGKWDAVISADQADRGGEPRGARPRHAGVGRLRRRQRARWRRGKRTTRMCSSRRSPRTPMSILAGAAGPRTGWRNCSWTSRPAAALDFADKGLGLDSSVIPELYAFYATTAVSNKMGDRLKDRLTKLIATKPENLEDILLKVTDAARDLIDNGHKAEGLDRRHDSRGPFRSRRPRARRWRRRSRTCAMGRNRWRSTPRCRRNCRTALKNYPDIAALEKKQPKFASAADVEKSISQHEDASEANDALGCALRVTHRLSRR